MRFRPLWPAALLLVAACAQPTQPATTPLPGPSTDTGASAAPSAGPTATLPPTSPVPSQSPTPAASGSALPSAIPSQIHNLDEGTHGPAPFPPAPAGTPFDLSQAAATATAGNVSAYGAIDGKPYTEWAARQAASNAVSLTIDLGSARPLSRLDLLPDASPDVKCFFNVDLSTDGVAFHTVASGSGTGSNQAPQWGSVSWPTETARYVRIDPTSWGTSWVGIWEVHVLP